MGWNNIRGTSAQPQERHIRGCERISHGKRHLATQVDVQNGDVRLLYHNGLQSSINGRKGSNDLQSVGAQSIRKIQCQERIVFDDHDAGGCDEWHGPRLMHGESSRSSCVAAIARRGVCEPVAVHVLLFARGRCLLPRTPERCSALDSS
jgi:hypothetical protein